MVKARAVKALALLALAYGFMLITPLLRAENELIAADFEKWPNNLGGDIGVYGSLEPNWADKAKIPYSWVYETSTAGYNKDNVHGGKQSFRLVNALGAKPDEGWGSFGMNLGRTMDATVTPIKVDSKDVSAYKYLTFWAKGEKGGEHMEVLFRDAKAVSYMPQTKYKIPDLTVKWQRVVVPLQEVKDQVDLTVLDNVSIAFGPDVGNEKGATVYLDDFVFTNQQ